MKPSLPVAVLGLMLLVALPPATGVEAQPGLAALERTLEMDRKIDTARAAIIRVWLADKPHMAPYREVIDAYMKDYLSWEVLRDEFRRDLAARFDADELAEIERFYTDGPGRKLGPAIETVLLDAFEGAKKRIVADQGKLNAMVRAEAVRIRKLQEDEKRKE